MENPVRPLRVHRSEEEINTLLKEFEGSNVTVKEFCEIYSVSEPTFYSWRNKYGAKNEKPGEFLTLVNDPAWAGQVLPAETANIFAELEIPGGVIVRFFEKVDAGYLKTLMYYAADRKKETILLYSQPVDLRNRFDGLVRIIREKMFCDPDNGFIYVFINKRKNTVAMLRCEDDGDD